MNDPLRSYTTAHGQRLELCVADLTRQPVDAIVNAANSALEHGGGVAAAICRAGGPQIQQESRAWVRRHGLVEHAHPAVTGAGSLPCRYVIHTVGPIWGSGDEEHKLNAALNGTFALADELKLASLALPAISTGIYRMPRQLAAQVIFDSFSAYSAAHPAATLTLVRLCLVDQATGAEFAGFFDTWLAQKAAR